MFSFVRSGKEHVECHAGGPPQRWTPSVSYTTRRGSVFRGKETWYVNSTVAIRSAVLYPIGDMSAVKVQARALTTTVKFRLIQAVNLPA